MTLNKLETKGVIKCIIDSNIGRRLMDLGFLPNKEVEYIRGKDPIEVRVGNLFIALRKEEAKLVELK